ncbi:Hypothetical_protein [Hexamita inflata]|uniref:Hypothetical_protein n=1 Tax=Hexamita inflata TaxID=28002 RepID=A0ABP1J673_9EUKA
MQNAKSQQMQVLQPLEPGGNAVSDDLRQKLQEQKDRLNPNPAEPARQNRPPVQQTNQHPEVRASLPAVALRRHPSRIQAAGVLHEEGDDKRRQRPEVETVHEQPRGRFPDEYLLTGAGKLFLSVQLPAAGAAPGNDPDLQQAQIGLSQFAGTSFHEATTNRLASEFHEKHRQRLAAEEVANTSCKIKVNLCSHISLLICVFGSCAMLFNQRRKIYRDDYNTYILTLDSLQKISLYSILQYIIQYSNNPNIINNCQCKSNQQIITDNDRQRLQCSILLTSV